ncbi:MAG: hypothetical protein ACYCVN_11695 [Acidimicrobiales bacterium]
MAAISAVDEELGRAEKESAVYRTGSHVGARCFADPSDGGREPQFGKCHRAVAVNAQPLVAQVLGRYLADLFWSVGNGERRGIWWPPSPTVGGDQGPVMMGNVELE